jgi:protocatechuate 3,4-dioxygenase, beta subunit
MSDTTALPFRPFRAGTQPPLDAPEYGSTARRLPLRALARLPGGQTATEMTGARFDPARYPELIEDGDTDGEHA